jgi:hypothetical protein
MRTSEPPDACLGSTYDVVEPPSVDQSQHGSKFEEAHGDSGFNDHRHCPDADLSDGKDVARFPSAVATMEASPDALLVSIETADGRNARAHERAGREPSRPVRVPPGTVAIQLVGEGGLIRGQGGLGWLPRIFLSADMS